MNKQIDPNLNSQNSDFLFDAKPQAEQGETQQSAAAESGGSKNIFLTEEDYMAGTHRHHHHHHSSGRHSSSHRHSSHHRHRRRKKKKMPVIIRDLDRDAATIIMVDSNLQRENILPSERAAAYKMKMEAIKRSAGRPTKNSPQVAANFRSDDEVAKGEDVSGDTIRRYIRLTELQPELQQMVDEKKIALTPAVEISYLKPDEQRLLLDTIESEQATPSLSQAQRMKKLSQSGELNDDTMLEILSEQKKPEKCDITLSGDILRKYFPRSYTPQRMQDTIIKLLVNWQRKREQKHER